MSQIPRPEPKEAKQKELVLIRVELYKWRSPALKDGEQKHELAASKCRGRFKAGKKRTAKAVAL